MLKVVLAIYVDDLKLSGPKANLPRAWSLIRSRIKTGDPTKIDRYLGCHHKVIETKEKRVMEYDMQNFLEQCLEKYEKACPGNVKYKSVATPFLEEASAIDD